MTTAQVVAIVVYAVIIAVWPVRLLVLEIILGRQSVLTPESPQYHQQSPPLVSAILPAKDEENYLAPCLRSICGQTYPNLEILVVDDRSTDRTALIALEIASTDVRVSCGQDRRIAARLDRQDARPRSRLSPRARRMALIRGCRYDPFAGQFRDHDGICASPKTRFLPAFCPSCGVRSFWERVMQPIAAITLMQSFPLHEVNNNRSKLAFANGQYILIERTAYAAAGGHQAVRDRFVEDIALCEHVKDNGLPDPRGPRPWDRVVPHVRILRTARKRMEPHLLRCAGSQSLAAHGKALGPDRLLPVGTSGIGRGPRARLRMAERSRYRFWL